MKTIISPSILGGSFSNMEKTISELDISKAKYIHFDVMDGDFVPNLTFGPQFISNLRTKTKKIFDVHLMINRVNKFLDDYIKAGSNIITFHYEINEDLNKLIDKIKQNRIKVGIALKPKTTCEEIKKYLHLVDQVIIMTVEPGFGGQAFLSNQVNKIESISKYNYFIETSIPSRPYILIIDQTFGDLSIKYGGSNSNNFDEMLKFAIEKWPDHLLLIKIHPDVIKKKKKGCINHCIICKSRL